MKAISIAALVTAAILCVTDTYSMDYGDGLEGSSWRDKKIPETLAPFYYCCATRDHGLSNREGTSFLKDYFQSNKWTIETTCTSSQNENDILLDPILKRELGSFGPVTGNISNMQKFYSADFEFAYKNGDSVVNICLIGRSNLYSTMKSLDDKDPLSKDPVNKTMPYRNHSCQIGDIDNPSPNPFLKLLLEHLQEKFGDKKIIIGSLLSYKYEKTSLLTCCSKQRKGHANYVTFTKEHDTPCTPSPWEIIRYEPVPICLKKEFFQKFFSETFGSTRINLKQIPLGHQIINKHDCGLFSLTYLLNHSQGIDPENLTSKDVVGTMKYLKSMEENGKFDPPQTEGLIIHIHNKPKEKPRDCTYLGDGVRWIFDKLFS